MKRTMNALLFIGVIGTAVSGFQFALTYGKAMWGNRDIWWNPHAMALSLDETRQDFQLLLSGDILQDHIARGSLSAVDSTGQPYRVVSDDIKVRLNNWHKVRASFLHSAVLLAFLLGVSLTCLVMGVVQSLTRRRETTQ